MTTDVLKNVIESGKCIGCGGCAFAAGGRMELDRSGFYQPSFSNPDEVVESQAVASSCPFLAPELNEDELADRFLPSAPNKDHKVGRYIDLFAAHVEEGSFRRSGSSGGMGSWIATELLQKGIIDGVIHVQPTPRSDPEDPFFRYGVSRTVKEVQKAAHSHYHVVEISEVLSIVKNTPGRYLFIGVPCMVKAVRRAQISDFDIADRIVYTIALVCGHLKSVHWAVSLGWAAGVEPDDIADITFRVKSENVPAKAYFFAVTRKSNGQRLVRDSAGLTGGKFNLGAMMPEACNYCDDVVGETADLTIGDAWLPQYSFDWRGKNMIVSRNPDLSKLILAGQKENRVSLDPMTAKDAAYAQAGGFRQRREGLAYRLKRDKSAGRWVPQKRSLPDMTQPTFLRARIYRLRIEVSKKAKVAFRSALDQGDLNQYDTQMTPLFKRLRRLEIIASATRIILVRLQALIAKRKL